MKQIKKIVAGFTIGILLANLLLFALRIYSSTIFWIIIGVCAIIAFPVMKRLK